MASMVSKLVRAAAAASRTCPAAVVARGSSRVMAPASIRSAGGASVAASFQPRLYYSSSSANNKVERDDPKSPSEAAAAVKIDPVIISPGKNTSEKDGPCSEEETPVQVRRTRRRKTKDPSKNLDVDAKSLESDEALWALYEYWCKYHGRERTRAEMKRRFKWFRRTAERVHKANSGGGSAICTLTHFADLRPMEMPMNYVMSRRTIPRRLLRN